MKHCGRGSADTLPPPIFLRRICVSPQGRPAAVAARATTTLFGLVTFLDLARGTAAAAGNFAGEERISGGAGGSGGARVTTVSIAGAAAAGWSADAFSALCTGSAAGAGAASSATRRSGTSVRRSCQGKPKPGSPRPWPLKVRVSSTAWNNKESSSPNASRLRSGVRRWRSGKFSNSSWLKMGSAG